MHSPNAFSVAVRGGHEDAVYASLRCLPAAGSFFPLLFLYLRLTVPPIIIRDIEHIPQSDSKKTQSHEDASEHEVLCEALAGFTYSVTIALYFIAAERQPRLSCCRSTIRAHAREARIWTHIIAAFFDGMQNVTAKEENVKVSNRDLPCWEIMQCKGTENCPARLDPEKPCWEIARELDDYRSALKICQDCIVFMLKNGNIILSEQEIRAIMKRKGSCALE